MDECSRSRRPRASRWWLIESAKNCREHAAESRVVSMRNRLFSPYRDHEYVIGMRIDARQIYGTIT